LEVSQLVAGRCEPLEGCCNFLLSWLRRLLNEKKLALKGSHLLVRICKLSRLV
jgi:hypothetical protein